MESDGNDGFPGEEDDLEELHRRAEQAEDEITELRRRLQEAPGRVRTLEERLLETKGQLVDAVSQNEKLTFTLQQAKEHIAALREEVDKLTQPPSAYGTYLAGNDDGTVDVISSGRKMRVAIHPGLDAEELRKGQEVVLNESLNVVLARDPERVGEVVSVLRGTGGRTPRARSSAGADEEQVAEISEYAVRASSCAWATRCFWTRGRCCCTRSCPAPSSKRSCSRRCRTSLTPTSAASTTRSRPSPTRWSCPTCIAELFAEYRLQAPKGILLYGPPGCGRR